MTTSQLSHLNNRLGRDLGRTPTGEPLLQWRWSESLRHPMRVPGFDFVDSPGGIAVAKPKYEVHKMNPAFTNQWVICRWEAPIPEAEWREAFGSDMAWPRTGEFYPTGMSLPAGMEPTSEWTDRVCAAERERRTKSLADHEAQVTREMDQTERYLASRRESIISDACTAFGKLPGSNAGGVSLPSIQPHQ
jgi:hypothetical protein